MATAPREQTIWKFPFQIADCFSLPMPKGARVLTAQEQHGEPVLWATVDPTAPKVGRTFYVCGTGHDLPEGVAMRYVATFQQFGGRLVWHVFEEVTR